MEHPEDKCCKWTKFKSLTDLKEDTEHQENNFLCEFNTYLHFLCSEKNFFEKKFFLKYLGNPLKHEFIRNYVHFSFNFIVHNLKIRSNNCYIISF